MSTAARYITCSSTAFHLAILVFVTATTSLETTSFASLRRRLDAVIAVAEMYAENVPRHVSPVVYEIVKEPGP